MYGAYSYVARKNKYICRKMVIIEHQPAKLLECPNRLIVSIPQRFVKLKRPVSTIKFLN